MNFSYDRQSSPAAGDRPMADALLHPIPEVQRRLGGMSRSAVYDLIAAGRLRTVHLGRRRLVTDAELRRLVAELEAEERPA